MLQPPQPSRCRHRFRSHPSVRPNGRNRTSRSERSAAFRCAPWTRSMAMSCAARPLRPVARPLPIHSRRRRHAICSRPAFQGRSISFGSPARQRRRPGSPVSAGGPEHPVARCSPPRPPRHGGPGWPRLPPVSERRAPSPLSGASSIWRGGGCAWSTRSILMGRESRFASSIADTHQSRPVANGD